jgi:hypothetical protein
VWPVAGLWLVASLALVPRLRLLVGPPLLPRLRLMAGLRVVVRLTVISRVSWLPPVVGWRAPVAARRGEVRLICWGWPFR